MTPFDTTTNSALAGRDLLKISGGILPLPGVAVAGYMSDDPSQSSSTQPVNYGTSVDVEAANFQIYVTQNTADTQSQFALLVNGTSIGSQNVAPGFTGATQVKAAQGLTIPAGSQIAMRISNPGTVGAGQHVKATGVLATVAQPSPARIYAPSFYFAGQHSDGFPVFNTITGLGNDTNELNPPSVASFSPGGQLVFNLYPPLFPVTVACAANAITIQINFAGAPAVNTTKIFLVKNAGFPTQQQIQFNITPGPVNEFLSFLVSSVGSMSFSPGDNVSCVVNAPGSVGVYIVTLSTIRT